MSGSWLIDLPTCPSTNTWALERLDALAPGAVVWTPLQTAGRGRSGAWRSPPGVLTASIIVAGRLPDARLALVAALAVVHACEDASSGLAALGARIKWPNDVYADGRKLAGVLIERPAGADRAVVGIGLNVDPQWPGAEAQLPETAALAAFGPAPTVPALLTGLRRYLLEGVALAATEAWPALLAQVRGRDALLGRQVRVGEVSGTGRGIDDDGHLLIGDDGQVVAVAGGHVEPG